MVVWVVIATLAATAHAYSPNATLDLFLRPTNPLFHLEPEDAWVDMFTNVDDSVYVSGMMGAGRPSVQAGPGARVTVQYAGKNVTFGGALNGTENTPLTFEVDGNVQPAPLNEPFENTRTAYRRIHAPSQDLPLGRHTASIGLSADASSNTRLDMQTVRMDIPVVASRPNISDVGCWRWWFSEPLTPGSTFTWLRPTGSWMISKGVGGRGGQPILPYETVYANRTASLTFTLPRSVTWFILTGVVGPSYGRYTVDLDPPPPIPYTMNTFSAKRRYVAVNQTMYFTPLDPEVVYTVKITGDQDPARWLGLNSFGVCFLDEPDYVRKWRGENIVGPTANTGGGGAAMGGGDGSLDNKPEDQNSGNAGGDGSRNPSDGRSAGTSSGSKSNVGAIAGGIAGGVVAAGALCALIFFLCRRKKRRAREKDGAEPFVIDATEDATTSVTPYKGEGYGLQPATGYAPNLLNSPHSPHAPATLPGPPPPHFHATPLSSDPPSTPRSGPSSGAHHPRTIDEKRSQQSFGLGADKPLNDETARALAAVLQKYHQTRGASQEEDAGPAPASGRTVPPSYNPDWVQRPSQSSGGPGTPGLTSEPEAMGPPR